MTERPTNDDRVSKIVLLALTVAITVLFLSMIRSFLVTLLMAGITAALLHPFYLRLETSFRGRRRTAAVVITALLVLAVLAPLSTFVGLAAGEAFEVAEQAVPWIQERIENPGELEALLPDTPFFQNLLERQDELLTRGGEAVAAAGAFLAENLAALTRGTFALLFQLLIYVVAVYVFLKDGEALLRRILWYLPLPDDDERRLLDRFTSITRATVKGTLLIGVLQGVLAGAAFAVAGIDGVLFWTTAMIVLSVVPGVGTGLVWIPAALILGFGGDKAAGIGLALWCALVVGSVDNVLRPRLVGRDTRMSDLLVLLSTLGGLMTFGVLGLILGPVLAGLFLTIWELYGAAFRSVLPPVKESRED